MRYIYFQITKRVKITKRIDAMNEKILDIFTMKMKWKYIKNNISMLDVWSDHSLVGYICLSHTL